MKAVSQTGIFKQSKLKLKKNDIILQIKIKNNQIQITKEQNQITYHDKIVSLLALVIYLWHTMTSAEGAVQKKSYRKTCITYPQNTKQIKIKYKNEQ